MAATMAQAARLIGTATRGRRLLLQSTALQAAVLLVVALPAQAQLSPNARPTGGVVTGGAATISTAPTTTTISQSSQKASIDWQSFNVGSGQKVTFAQPSASAVTLNRVNSPDPSVIAGQINANGQIIIANQSGVVFTQGSVVNAQSVVASAASISAADFMAGKTAFNQPAQPNARVFNKGTITAGQAGLVGLVAPRVANSGVINAKLGTVVLAGAQTHTLDLYGDGLLSIDVTNQVQQAPTSKGGKSATALVTNTGTIIADGGNVTLTAAAADGIVQTLVDAGGHIQARSAGGQTGRITIAGTGGSVQIDGVMDASGPGSGQTGGSVAVAATGTVTVAPTARIRASGAAGGGSVTLGSLSATQATLVQAGARISANATRSGPGGTVKLLSTSATRQAGRITARGGRSGGNGGTVEISTQGGLQLGGSIDVSARRGAPGTVFVDPLDVTIATGGTGTGSEDIFTSTTIDPATLNSFGGNVIVQASRSLTVESSVSVSTQGASLTLQSASDMRIDPGVTLTASGAITLSAATVEYANTPGNYNPAATLTIGGNVVAQGGNDITLSSGAGGIVIGGNLIAQGVSLSTGGPVTQTGGIVVTSGGLADGLSGSAASVSLNQPNQIDNVVLLQSTNGGVAISEAAGGTLGLGQISVSDGQTIRLRADNIASLGTLASSGLVAPGGTVSLAPVTAGRGVELFAVGTVDPTQLSIPPGLLANSGGATLALGTAASGAVSIGRSGDDIELRPAFVATEGAGFSTLQITTGGAVTQGGSLGVGTIALAAASVSLPSMGNQIAQIGGATTTGSLTIASGQDLTVAGPVASGGTVTIASGGSLTLAANVTAPAAVLDSGYSTSQIAGVIDTPSLSGAVTGADGGGGGPGQIAENGEPQPPSYDVTLPDANQVSAIDGYALRGNFTYAGTVPLTIRGVIGEATANTGAVSLSNTGGIAVAGTGSVVAASVRLAATGAIAEASGGSIATSLLAASGTTVSLGSVANLVTATGALTATASGGNVTLADAAALTVSGTASVLSGGTIALFDDSIGAISKALLSAPGGIVQLAPLTAGRGVELISGGTATTGVLSIGPGLVDSIQAGTLQAGSASAGAITIGPAGDTVELATHVGALQLTSGAGITETGAVNVATLTGSAVSAALGGANTIQTLGAFATNSGFALNDIRPLTVQGPVSDPTAIVITDSAGLVLTGIVGGSNVSLATSGDLVQTGGIVTATGTLSLAAVGEIAQSGGSLGGGTLTGSAGAVSLVGTGNDFVDLGPFTALKSFALTVGKNLTVIGPVAAPSVTLAIGNNLAIDSAVTANGVTLDVGGTISEGSTGSIVQSGTGVLTGYAATAQLVQANAVASLGDFATNTGFTLNDTVPLAVVGIVTDPVSVTLRSAGAMSLSGTVDAGAVSLGVASSGGVGGSLTQTGGAIDGTSVSLAATGGIAQTGGVLAAGTLSGAGGSTVSLAETGNAIATLGSFSSEGGFVLATTGNLAMTGPVSDPVGVALDVAGNLALSGGIGSGAVTFAATGEITQPSGAVTATTLTGSSGGGAALAAPGNAVGTLDGFSSVGGFTLADAVPLTVAAAVVDTARISLSTTGALTLAAGIGGPGTTAVPSVTLSAGGTLAQTGGIIAAGTLSGQGAGVALNDANAIAGLGALASTGGLAVTDTRPVSIIGPISVGSAQTLTLADDAPTFAGGSLAAPGGTVALVPAVAGDALTLGGSNAAVTAGTLVAGAANGGPVTITGNLSFANVATLDLLSAGAIAETGQGAVAVGTLTGDGASASLGGGNAVGTLGAFTTTGGFALANAGNLAVAGPVNDPVSVALTSGGNLSLSGAVGTGAVTLAAAGAVSQSAGQITATTLSGQAGSVALGQPNAVAQIGTFASHGTFLLADAAPLAVVGPVSAVGALTIEDAAPTLGSGGALVAPGGTVTLAPLSAGGSLAVSGIGTTPAVTAATLVLGSTAGGPLSLVSTLDLANVPTLELLSGGAISQGAGAITVGVLTGQGASVALGGANTIATLGAFASAGDFLLTSASPLTVAGTVSVGSAGQTLTLAADQIAFGPGALLSAPASFVALQPYGSNLTLSGANGATGAAISSAAGVIVGGSATQSISIASGINFGAATPVSLTGAEISETASGAIGAASLGANANDVTLTGANQIAAFGSVGATGTVAINDAQSLRITGGIDGALGVSIAAVGDIVFSGTGSLSSLGPASVVATGSVSEQGGSLMAASVTGSAASASLTGTNNFASLQGFTTTGALTVSDTAPLGVTGAVTAGGSLSLSTASALALGANLVAPAVSLSAAGAITQSAGSITSNLLSGNGASVTLTQPNRVGEAAGLTASGSISLATVQPLEIAQSGITAGGALSLSVTGSIDIESFVSGTTVALASTGGITEPHPGTNAPATGITATTLTGSAQSVNLPGTNAIQSVGSFTAPGGFTLDNAGPISVASLNAATVSLTATGNVGLGAVSAVSLDVETTGAVDNAVGTPAIGTLSGSAASVALTGNIITLGSFTTTGSLSLTSNSDLVVTGPVASPAASLSAGYLLIDGTISAASFTAQSGESLASEGGALNAASASLTAAGGSLIVSGGTINAGSLTLDAFKGSAQTPPSNAGDIVQTGGGISAGLLAGQSDGSVSLGQNGQAMVVTLSRFQSGTAASLAPFALNNGGSLAIAGNLLASSVSIAAPGSITLGESGANVALTASGAITIAAIAGANGSAGITQIGTYQVSGSALSLQIAGNGALQLNALQAPGVPVTLALAQGTANGSINVGSLLVVGHGGSASLSGSVGGVGGFAAAIASQIQPAFDMAYQLNGCAIMSVTCTVSPPPPVARSSARIALVPSTIFVPSSVLPPDVLTLDLLSVDLAGDRDAVEVPLPNISDRDY